MNKTSKYLGSFYKASEDYKSLKEMMDNFHHKEYFIADTHFYEIYNLTELQNFCFVVCDTYGQFDSNAGVYVNSPTKSIKEFSENIKKLRKNKFVICDYKLSRISNKHILVLKLPQNQNKEDVGRLLVDGKYSEIWTTDQIKEMYKIYKENDDTSKYIKESNKLKRNIKDVLLRKEEYKAIFRKLIADKYKVDQSVVDDNNELDVPLKEEWKGELINPSESWLYQIGLKTIKDLNQVTSF